MPLVFGKDIHCRLVDGRAIFLDLSTGRYASPSAQASRALARLADHAEWSGPWPEALRPLRERGWLVEADEPGATGFARWPLPERSWQGDTSRDPAPAAVGLALLREVAAILEMRVSRFRNVVTGLRSWPVRERTTGAFPTIGELVGAFDRADRILSPRNRCLPRSIALMRTLRDIGEPAHLVIGVRTYPFLAHAWVQLQGRVIGDDLDRVRAYSPILQI